MKNMKDTQLDNIIQADRFGKSLNPKINMGDNGSLRNSACWDGNGKKLSGMWPSWDGARSKAFGQDHENGKGSWIQSQGWTASGDGNTMAFKKGWNDSEDVKAKKELSQGNTAFYLDGIDRWRQSNPKINLGDYGSLRKSTCWDRSADDNGKKEIGGWPSWDDARSKTVEKYTQQNGKGAWDQSKEWIAVEDDNTITGKGVWHETKAGKAKKETQEGSSRKSACWDRPEDGNDKKESGGWPSWDGASSKKIELYANPKNGKVSWNQSQGWGSSEDDTTMACKNGWNDSEDVKAKRDLNECSDAIYLDGTNGWRQSNPKISTVDKGSFKKSACWDRSADGNGKKESVEWPSWNDARSKAVGKYTHHQKREGVWNQAQELIALDDGTAITGKGGWNEFEDDMAKKETSENDWRKSACWDKYEGDNEKKESGGWPSWDGASSMTIGPKNGKGSLNQSLGWNSEDAKAKRKFCEGGETFYLDGIEGRREYNPKTNMVDKCNLRKSTYWNRATDDIGKESGRQPSWNGARFNSFGKYTSRQNGKGDLNQSQGWNALKDGTSIEGIGGASTDFRDSPRWLSRRGSQFRRGVGNAVRQYSERDIEGFRDNKKARYPRNDRWINSENPWKQRNHLKDTLTPRQESCFHGVKESTFSRNDSSYVGCNHENAGMVSSWNGLKIPNATVTDQLRQSHTMIDSGGFRGETIKSTATSPKQNADQGVRYSQHWKAQPKYYISQQTPQNIDSLSDNQNDHTTDSGLQFGQNMQVNSQLPSLPDRSNSKVEVQNHEQQAMPNGELFRKNDDPVGKAFIQVNEDSSSSNLRSRFSPASIRSSKTSEEKKSNSTKFISIDKNLNQSWDVSLHDPLADNGIRMFKATLVEFVKNAIKPIWKEGGLSKEAHKTVVKKVVDKVTGVLGSKIPQTQEMIDQYMSFANVKLHKLIKDYLEMFINT